MFLSCLVDCDAKSKYLELGSAFLFALQLHEKIEIEKQSWQNANIESFLSQISMNLVTFVLIRGSVRRGRDLHPLQHRPLDGPDPRYWTYRTHIPNIAQLLFFSSA